MSEWDSNGKPIRQALAVDGAPIKIGPDQMEPGANAPPAATTTVVGGVKQVAAQADSAATDVEGLVDDFNTLLANMRAAGIIAT